MSNLLKNSIIDIINNYNDFFLNKSNVNGIGLGHKIINGMDTKEPCLGIFVENKVTSKKLYKHEIIPKKFLGIKTDIVEATTPKILNSTNTLPINVLFKDKFVRPIQPGYSIGIGSGYYGTLGAIVFDNDNNAPYILSNNHVLANSNANDIGTYIIQPGEKNIFGNEEGFSGMITNAVASLYKKVILKSGNAFNEVDCAIAKIFPNTAYNKEIHKIGKITGVTNVEIGDEVKKTGGTTEYTTGTITYTNTIRYINFSEFKETVWFKDCIICSKMSEKGDSGSLVLNSYNKAIGLLFAGGDTETVVNPINQVLKVLNIHF